MHCWFQQATLVRPPLMSKTHGKTPSLVFKTFNSNMKAVGGHPLFPPIVAGPGLCLQGTEKCFSVTPSATAVGWGCIPLLSLLFQHGWEEELGLFTPPPPSDQQAMGINPNSIHNHLAHQLQQSLHHHDPEAGWGCTPWLCGTALMSEKGRWEHLLSDERDGIWEVGLEKTQHLLACRELLKFLKGHEERAGEGLVLPAREEGQKEDQRPSRAPGICSSCSVPSLSPSYHSNPPVQWGQAPSHPVTCGGLAHAGDRQGGGRNRQHVICQHGPSMLPWCSRV